MAGDNRQFFIRVVLRYGHYADAVISSDMIKVFWYLRGYLN